VRDWQFVDYTSGPFSGFAASQDLLGDGSVVLLPTPGHGPGHQCVLVRMENYDLLITGDILYTLRHLAVDQVRALQFGGTLERQQIDSIRRIRALRHALPDLVLVPGHDHSAYQLELLEPFLADGGLSAEERQAIRRYESALFDDRDDLRPAAFPRFVSGTAPGSVGRVVEPVRSSA
jgi:glyoxylase-like metal-dependent hydrolase (beta-lactamase superfamily II)